MPASTVSTSSASAWQQRRPTTEPAHKEAELRVHVVSESAFTIDGHGVHSAFEDHARYLAARIDVEVVVNGSAGRAADVVHVHTVGPYAASMMLSTSGARVVSAHVVPDSLAGSIVGGRRLRRVAGHYFSWFYNRADLVVAVSEYVKAELLRLGVRAPIAVIPNWILSDEVVAARARRHDTRSRLDVGTSDTLVISVGQLQPRKGVHAFLETARKLPHVMFLWAGEAIFGAASVERSSLRRALAQAPPNVIYAGHVGRRTVYELLAAADIYLSLSQQETFGVAVLEAATARLPLVLSELPVFHDVYGAAAQYVACDTAASVVADLAASEPSRCAWAARAARVAEQYRWDVNGESLLGLYRSLVDSS